MSVQSLSGAIIMASAMSLATANGSCTDSRICESAISIVHPNHCPLSLLPYHSRTARKALTHSRGSLSHQQPTPLTPTLSICLNFSTPLDATWPATLFCGTAPTPSPLTCQSGPRPHVSLQTLFSLASPSSRGKDVAHPRLTHPICLQSESRPSRPSRPSPTKPRRCPPGSIPPYSTSCHRPTHSFRPLRIRNRLSSVVYLGCWLRITLESSYMSVRPNGSTTPRSSLPLRCVSPGWICEYRKKRGVSIANPASCRRSLEGGRLGWSRSSWVGSGRT